MGLSNGYGVAIGTLKNYYRDPINNYGQYYHANVELQTPLGIYKCAIDVDSKSLPNGVEWRVVELGNADLKGLLSFSSGWYPLESNSSSGALDYIRSKEFQPNVKPQWKQGTSKDALIDLEPLLINTKRIYIFGEPFTNGLGVHNIHQNQGDPDGSTWWNENGIWQDGGTIIERQDHSVVAFLNKFITQSYSTDNNGHQIEAISYKDLKVIDPMALILGPHSKAYLIWCEIHHPNLPKVADVKQLMESMTTEERELALLNAKAIKRQGKLFMEYGEVVEKTLK
ncbi:MULTISPECIES: YukJ family protein [Clostridium]|uniref:YukJ family protein n=1 Tax=Clostridium cibarium TaxID=2762247 RepID=A0ABR8PZ02_9CLOT|nr:MULTISPECIES: YukJ family protein [Clostridium]MBD7913386.1 YukJ family protein [Clostridium cibarium]